MERSFELNKAILLQAEDWEGLFINGRLVEEGHTLNEGNSRIKCFVGLAKKYNFNLEEMKEQYVTEEDEQYLYDCGSFPTHLSRLNGNYQ